METKNSFVLYTNYREQISLLDNEEKGILFDTILAYAAGKTLPELPGIVAMAFSFIKAQMDRDQEEYDRKVKARSEAGKRGGRPKANAFLQKQAKANESKEKQNNPDNENENVNDKALPSSDEEGVEKPERIFATIRELYNSVCGSYPRLVKMSEARKRAVRARLKSGYSTDDFQRLFEKAESSDFLKGKNDRNWAATFDWLIADRNMAKVLDGNYDNRTSAGKKNGKDWFNQFDQRNYDFDVLEKQLTGG